MPEMNKPDITSPADIAFLIDTFYQRVLKDKSLAPFFNQALENWATHRERIIRYWTAHILSTDGMDSMRTPLKQHLELDQISAHQLTRVHFNQWTALWSATIDEFFQGTRAVEAKQHAFNAGLYLYLKTLLSRQ